MKHLLLSVIDFVLPRFCVSCARPLSPREKIVCASCQLNIKKASPELIQLEYNRKFYNDRIISDFNSLYVFEKDKELQHIIHALKYDKRFLIGLYLGGLMASFLEKDILNWNIDFIIPVPLHKRRILERGYNQSYFIAKGLSRKIKKPLKNRCLKRVRYTGTQTSLTKKDRDKNIKDAFLVRNRKTLKGKRVLLLDDVITTGATVSECARRLLAAGAEAVYAVSAGIAE